MPSGSWIESRRVPEDTMIQDRSMSEAERRASMAQAIANARLEGWEPDAAFLGLAGQVVNNELTHEEAIALIIAQAQATGAAVSSSS